MTCVPGAASAVGLEERKGMPRLVGIVSAPPPHVVTQAMAAGFARDMFGPRLPGLERVMPVFDHAGIETRRTVQPPDWYLQPRSFAEANEAYIRHATTLCAEASSRLLTRHGVAPDAIDRIVYVNSTGLATPSIDARLANVLGLRRQVRRTPMWGLGCAGGAAGLAHAYEHLRGHPRDRVLLCAAEFCSLTFVREDASAANIVATALFGDGAAAALLCGDEVESDGLEIVAAQSTLYPDSLDIMGWSVQTHGLQVVFDRRIPQLVRDEAAAELSGFLARHGLEPGDVAEWLYHPGGPRVLEAYAEAYRLPVDRWAWSLDVLRRHGNMSSVTLLYVLEAYLAAHRPSRRAWGVASALGPGFSSELLLFRI